MRRLVGNKLGKEDIVRGRAEIQVYLSSDRRTTQDEEQISVCESHNCARLHIQIAKDDRGRRNDYFLAKVNRQRLNCPNASYVVA